LLRRIVPPRPIPGPVPREIARVQQAVADKTLTALKKLFGPADAGAVRGSDRKPGQVGGCVQCHEWKSAAEPLVDLAAASSREIRPVVVQSLWFDSAVFNHATHRALECGHCHQGVRESKDQTQSLLPKIAQCVDCHAPAETQGGRPRGGAGVACVECHRYHGGDHRREGLGAAARRGAELSLEEFLNGRAASQSH
jgi:hypothetical protein